MNILHKQGDKLPNGGIVIASLDHSSNCNYYVLAVYRGEFVTWLYSAGGKTCHGNYFTSLCDAIKDLYKRSDVIFSDFLEQ